MLVLDKLQQKEIKAGRAEILKCSVCGKDEYYGSMNLIALAISKKAPTCLDPNCIASNNLKK